MAALEAADSVAILVRPPTTMNQFMFATGIECSYPTIPTAGGGRKRIDELAKCGHYKHWRTDFHLVKEMGIGVLRFGGPYYSMHTGPGQYDWSFLDMTLPVLKDMGIAPILDLCHFGVPDWVGNFQNEDWPPHFAEFAGAIARRYPWVDLYTPVNEIYVAALYSGQLGFWNEAIQSDKGFVRALVNLCRANVSAMNAISDVHPDVRFVQSESTQFFFAEEPQNLDRAYFLNERRFLALDLTYAYPMAAKMYRYLLDNGMRQEEYDWFQAQTMRARCIMGTDYYVGNEHAVPKPDYAGGAVIRDQKRNDYQSVSLGYYPISKQYFDRYRIPVMHTETNMDEPYSEYWLWQNWTGAYRLYQDGIPLLGFTWYSLTDQVDWDSSLREDAGRVNPLGLFDLDRNIRPVGRSFKKLIENWSPEMQNCRHSLRESRW